MFEVPNTNGIQNEINRLEALIPDLTPNAQIVIIERKLALENALAEFEHSHPSTETHLTTHT